jgi:hypothetical protein
MHGGRSSLTQDNILPPPTEEIINDFRQESDDDGEIRCLNPGSFPTMKRDFQMFELTVETMIIRQQRYHNVI